MNNLCTKLVKKDYYIRMMHGQQNIKTGKITSSVYRLLNPSKRFMFRPAIHNKTGNATPI